MSDCEECEYYPIYGVAPHECYWRKPGGFNNPLGTSTIEPFDKWPENFVAEIDPSKKVSDQIAWGLCGIYYCPCKGKAKGNGTDLLDIDQLKEAIRKESSICAK